MQRSKQHKAILDLLPQVRRCAQHVAKGGSGRHDLRDLEQDGLVALLKMAPRYNGSTKFTTFVGYRLKGAMIDGLRQWHPTRRRDKAAGRTIIQWEPLPDTFSQTEPSRAKASDEIALAGEVLALVATLPPKQARVLYALFWQEYSAKELAAELGICVTRVFQLRRKGLAKLRKVMKVAA